LGNVKPPIRRIIVKRHKKKKRPIFTRGFTAMLLLMGIGACVVVAYMMRIDEIAEISDILPITPIIIEETEYYEEYEAYKIEVEQVVWVPPNTLLLDDFFSQYGTDLAVFYKNLETGFIYVHNPERVFFGASLSKITHAMYVYTLAERGLVDMYHVHTFTASDWWGGTGNIRFMPAGTRFTTRELLAHSMIYSCNVAARMLVRFTEGLQPSYYDFVREIGADPSLIRDVISQNTSAEDIGLWMYWVHNYLESDSRYGGYFMYDLLNTATTSHPYFTRWEGSFGVGGQVNVSLLQSDYPMARKYGWATNAFHDAAIVYAPSPYILVVLTNMDRGAHELFQEISMVMQEFNETWF